MSRIQIVQIRIAVVARFSLLNQERPCYPFGNQEANGHDRSETAGHTFQKITCFRLRVRKNALAGISVTNLVIAIAALAVISISRATNAALQFTIFGRAAEG